MFFKSGSKSVRFAEVWNSPLELFLSVMSGLKCLTRLCDPCAGFVLPGKNHPKISWCFKQHPLTMSRRLWVTGVMYRASASETEVPMSVSWSQKGPPVTLAVGHSLASHHWSVPGGGRPGAASPAAHHAHAISQGFVADVPCDGSRWKLRKVAFAADALHVPSRRTPLPLVGPSVPWGSDRVPPVTQELVDSLQGVGRAQRFPAECTADSPEGFTGPGVRITSPGVHICLVWGPPPTPASF